MEREIFHPLSLVIHLPLYQTNFVSKTYAITAPPHTLSRKNNKTRQQQDYMTTTRLHEIKKPLAPEFALKTPHIGPDMCYEDVVKNTCDNRTRVTSYPHVTHAFSA